MTPAAYDRIAAMISLATDDFEAGRLDRESFTALVQLGINSHQELHNRQFWLKARAELASWELEQEKLAVGVRP